MISVTALFKAVQADIWAKYPDLGSSENEMFSDDPNRFAHAYLLENVVKKQTMSLDRGKTEHAALTAFLAVNERMEAYFRRPCHEWEEELYGCFKRQVYNFFYPRGNPLIRNWDEIVSKGDLGSGSNIGAVGTDFYTKLFSSPLTATYSDLYNTYRTVIDRNTTWADAEATRINSGYAVMIVNANKMSFVAKNDRTDRVIATEPTLNMLFQRGISNIIESRLRDYGIDLASQPDRNRELARLGSIDGAFSTIDLSSASDSISLRGVCDWIPWQQLLYLVAVRSPNTLLPSGELCKLHMLSTMGNGYTFSLQTALFLCVVLAAFEFAGARPNTNPRGTDFEPNFGVFGDDIIVPTGSVTRYTLNLLDQLGFVVNASKTFVEGPFRESCGGDFFHGENVRPFFAREWATQEERYALANRLHWWMRQHGDLPKTRRLIHKSLGDRVHFVPFHFPDDSGIQIPYSLAVRVLKKDTNGTLVTKYRRFLTGALAVTDGSVKSPDKGERIYNPSGLLLACIKGTATSSTPELFKIPTRIKCGRYATRVAHVPNWDSPTSDRGEFVSLPRAWLAPRNR